MEFSTARRVVTTIQDLMQYKRWVARQGTVIPEEEILGVFTDTDDEMDNAAEDESVEDEEEDEEDGGLSEWLKEWYRSEQISEKVREIVKKRSM